MKIAPCLLFVTVAAAFSATASAQIVAEPPFSGQYSDSFETQTSGQFTTCIQGRVFGNTADLCDSTGGTGMHITSGWGFICTIMPNSGGKLFGSGGGPALYTFDQPASRFGGYFGTNCGQANATVEFYDSNGVLLGSQTANVPANCSWTWNGWRAVSGSGIKSIKIIGLNNFGGGYVHLDSMEVDYGSPCPLPVTYCTPKVNSLGCTPTIAANGTASATAASGLQILATNVRNQKAGLLIYSVTGRASTPFYGGFLCMQLPVRRTTPTNSGGTQLPASDCTGAYSIDMNTFARGTMPGSHPLAALGVPGTVVDVQFWGVDPGFPAPNNVAMTEGLEYIVCP